VGKVPSFRPKANHRCLAIVQWVSQGAAELHGNVMDPLGKGGTGSSSSYLVVSCRDVS